MLLQDLIRGVDLGAALASSITDDYERLADGLPPRLEEYVLAR